MKHADIYWADLVDRGGREQFGRRPCIVWHDTAAFPTPTILIVPLTSKLSALSIPGTLRIDPSPGNGLSVPSIALVFQLNSIDRSRFGSFIGKLDDPDLLAVADLARKLQRL
jgi:mRNA-degrading endonuclease toxin of MazEF toxin-antitoxin module